VIAREWFSKYSANWAANHSSKIIRCLERDVFPWLGAIPITELDAPTLLSTMQHIENRGALETAHRILGSCGQIFRYAIATGRVQRNPTSDLRGALPPFKNNHFAAIVEPKQVGELLRAIDGYQGTFIVQCALQ